MVRKVVSAAGTQGCLVLQSTGTYPERFNAPQRLAACAPNVAKLLKRHSPRLASSTS